MSQSASAQLRIDNLDKVLAHLQAEFSNDVDTIMATVESDPRFAILSQEADGFHFSALEDTPGVREHYASMRTSLDVVTSRQVKRVVADWFVFQQSVATMRATGDIEGIPGNGRKFPVDTAVLFPVGPNGIIGEFPFNRTSFAVALNAPEPHREPPAADLIPLVDRHESLVDAIVKQDVAAICALFDDDCYFANRSYAAGPNAMGVATGKAALHDALKEEFAAWTPIQATVLNRIVTSWYVLAEVSWRGLRRSGGEQGPVSFETVTLLPVNRLGLFIGGVGHGSEVRSE